MRALITILSPFLCSLLLACGGHKAQAAELQTVDVSAAAALVRSGVTVVDVRSAEEWQEGHLQVARWSPIDRGEEGLAALELDPAQPVLLYCRSGGRAEKAGQWLQQMGHTQVRVLRPGGFAELKASGLPTE